MAVKAPDWLTQRDGSLKLGSDGRTWFVFLNGEPQYRLTPIPAAGKHSCHVVQTINGKRLDRGGLHGSLEDALSDGLDDLRAALGW